MNKRTIGDLCKSLPKVELHRHFEGSLRPQLLMRIAKHNGLRLPFKTIEEYHQLLEFKPFSDFILIFSCGVRCLRTPIDFYEATIGLRRQLHADVTITPQFYLNRPFPLVKVFKAIHAAAKKVKEHLDVEIRWVTDLVRNKLDLNEITFHKLMKMDLMQYGVHALGLGGPEEGHSGKSFQAMFAEAKRQGLKSNPLAGEGDGPASVALCMNELKAD